jgi:hypothetical protein
MSVVTEHSRFMLATDKDLEQEQSKLYYDIYDRANDAAASKFLLASSSQKLSRQIFERLRPTPRSPAWHSSSSSRSSLDFH